jgi:hypothetical protein
MSKSYTDEQLENGRRKLAAFREWLRDNPRACEFAERFALDALDAGQHVSGRAIVEHIRRHEFTDEHGRPTRINNDFAAVIARRLVRDHPEYAGRLELRPCVFDVLMAGGGTNA